MSISKDIDETLKRLNKIEQKLKAYKESRNKTAIVEFCFLFMLVAMTFAVLIFI